MKRSSSASGLSSLPRAPTLEVIKEDVEAHAVAANPAPAATSSTGDASFHSVTLAELEGKEQLFQAMYYCARNDLAGLKLIYHADKQVISQANYDNRTW